MREYNPITKYSIICAFPLSGSLLYKKGYPSPDVSGWGEGALANVQYSNLGQKFKMEKLKGR
jgi:hypothetical protein